MEKALLAIALASILLLSGCASDENAEPGAIKVPGYVAAQPNSSKPAEPWVQNVTEPLKNATPNETSTQGVACRINVSLTAIDEGSSAEIDYFVYSAGKTEFTFLCGDETVKISDGGFVSGKRICKFSKPGNVTVWLKANKKVCAQQALEVRPVGRQTGNCYIDSESVERDLSSHYYKATVHFEGFSSEDRLAWTCDYTTTTRKLGSDPVLGMPLYETISCDFKGSPVKDSIPVSVGGVSCGYIPTR